MWNIIELNKVMLFAGIFLAISILVILAIMLEMLKNNILQTEYNEALAKYERKQLDIEIDIKIPPLSKEIVERVIEGNPSWTAGQIMAVTDIFM